MPSMQPRRIAASSGSPPAQPVMMHHPVMHPGYMPSGMPGGMMHPGMMPGMMQGVPGMMPGMMHGGVPGLVQGMMPGTGQMVPGGGEAAEASDDERDEEDVRPLPKKRRWRARAIQRRRQIVLMEDISNVKCSAPQLLDLTNVELDMLVFIGTNLTPTTPLADLRVRCKRDIRVKLKVDADRRQQLLQATARLPEPAMLALPDSWVDSWDIPAPARLPEPALPSVPYASSDCDTDVPFCGWCVGFQQRYPNCIHCNGSGSD